MGQVSFKWNGIVVVVVVILQEKKSFIEISIPNYPFNKVGCIFPMVVVSILPRAEFGPKDHREDALHFI